MPPTSLLSDAHYNALDHSLGSTGSFSLELTEQGWDSNPSTYQSGELGCFNMHPTGSASNCGVEVSGNRGGRRP